MRYLSLVTAALVGQWVLTAAITSQAQTSHLDRVEKFDQQNLFTDEQRQLLIVLVKLRMGEQGAVFNPMQETLLLQLQKNRPLNMGELTALAAICTSSHNDEALAIREKIFTKVRELRAERDLKGYAAQHRQQEQAK